MAANVGEMRHAWAEQCLREEPETRQALAALAVWLCNAHRLNAGKAPLLGRLPRAADTGDHSCADETAQPCAAAPADSDTTIKHSSAAGPSAGQEE